MHAGRARTALLAIVGTLAAPVVSCTSGTGPGAGDAGTDTAFDTADALETGDGAPGIDVAPDGTDAANGGCVVATCFEPCVFSFRNVADDRDGLSEVRLAASGGVAGIVSMELVDTPVWVTFSSRFADYLVRISGGSWSIDSALRFVDEGEAIGIPDAESVAIELRADDPGTQSCAAGSCGFVRVYVDDCAAGTSAVNIPVAR